MTLRFLWALNARQIVTRRPILFSQALTRHRFIQEPWEIDGLSLILVFPPCHLGSLSIDVCSIDIAGQLIRTPSAGANSNIGCSGGSQAKSEDFTTIAPTTPGQQGNGMKLRLLKSNFSPTTEVEPVADRSMSDVRRQFKPATPSPPPPPPTATNGSFYLNDVGKIGGGGGVIRKAAVTSCLCPKHSTTAAAAAAAAAADMGVLTRDSETQTLVTSLVPSKHRSFVRKKSETCKIATSMGEFR